ncbi:MAG: AgmX/PglI C-terminal domain-containing protein, partial [Myxococcota bacterium]
PAPEPEPQAAPEPERKPKKQPKLRAQKPQKNVKKQQAGGTSEKPAGVLGLLSKRGSSAAPGPASAVASLSNLKASKVPGSKGGFKASGLIGKAPSSGVNLGGGGGGLATKGALSLLKGGKGGAGRIKGGAVSGRVRGMVSKAPPRRIAQSGGTLSRDEIQKVINKNIGQIQRCYERELTKNASLSGKVTIQWTVGTSGSVTTASQKKSSLPSTDAVNCMIRSIKSWRFPAPRGGPAIVTYPFAFRAVSG